MVWLLAVDCFLAAVSSSCCCKVNLQHQVEATRQPCAVDGGAAVATLFQHIAVLSASQYAGGVSCGHLCILRYLC